MKLKRLVVIGAGAVGGCIGGMLSAHGHPVAFIARGEHGELISKNGLHLETSNEQFRIRVPTFERAADVDWQSGDVVMLATKLQDAQQVLDDVLSAAGPEIPVICATNGIAGEKWAPERFQHSISMLVWVAATYLEAGKVQLFMDQCAGVLDNGPIRVNESFSEVALLVSEQVSNWLRDAAFDTIVRRDMPRWKYGKWITNLGNAAQALIEDDWLSVAKATQAEGEAILTAAKIDYVSPKELSERIVKIKIKPINGEERGGGSTWQSLQRGQKLETPWIEGAMADLADQIGVPAPLNRAISELAKNPRRVPASEILSVLDKP